MPLLKGTKLDQSLDASQLEQLLDELSDEEEEEVVIGEEEEQQEEVVDDEELDTTVVFLDEDLYEEKHDDEDDYEYTGDDDADTLWNSESRMHLNSAVLSFRRRARSSKPIKQYVGDPLHSETESE